MAEKCLLDMTEEELLAHHQRVLVPGLKSVSSIAFRGHADWKQLTEDRANATKEDRALLVLERTQDSKNIEHEEKMNLFDNRLPQNSMKFDGRIIILPHVLIEMV